MTSELVIINVGSLNKTKSQSPPDLKREASS